MPARPASSSATRQARNSYSLGWPCPTSDASVSIASTSASLTSTGAAYGDDRKWAQQPMRRCASAPHNPRMHDHFTWLDATECASLVRSGAVHPRELVDAAIARIEQVDPKLNAVVHRSFERARAAAE